MMSNFPTHYKKVFPGSEKKVISFSLYGEKPLYYLGAELNVKEAKEIYPDYICRFYCAQDVPNLEVLKKLDCEVIVPDLDSPPVFWRFLACDDPDVDICLQRDCDSIVNPREKAAVDDWLSSGKSLHLMHDCKIGHFHKVMAGMWGIINKGRLNFELELNKFFSKKNYSPVDQNQATSDWGSGSAVYFDDQLFLEDVVFNFFKNDYIEHGDETPFPKHDPIKYGSFVGDRVFASELLNSTSSEKSNEIFIQSHLAMEDQFPLNGLIRYFCKKFDKVYFPVRVSNLNLIKFCLSDLKNLEFVELKGNIDGVDIYSKNYDRSVVSFLGLGNYGKKVTNCGDFIDCCYVQADLKPSQKKSDFIIPDTPKDLLPVSDLNALNKLKRNLGVSPDLDLIEVEDTSSFSDFAVKDGKLNLDRILQRPEKTHKFLIDGLKEMGEKYLKDNSVVVEIGCYAGESTKILLETGKIDKIYCIDPWANDYDNSDESSFKAPMDFVENLFDESIKPFKDKLVKLKMRAEDAFAQIKDSSIDLVYLDGEHTYEANERYLNLYNPKLKPDGFMCGHDWGFGELGKTGHSQTEAIRRFFNSEPIDIFKDNSWVYNKKNEDIKVNNFNINKNKKRIAFHTNEIGVRGSEWATYKYAHYNEKTLGNESIYIAGPTTSQFERPESHKAFSERFKVYRYDNWDNVDDILSFENIDILYMHKGGNNDGKFSKKVKTCIHSVFQMCDPHGDKYAYISEWLSQVMDGGKHPFVPYMVDLPNENSDLRGELGIPKEAIVFGRLGGPDQFDIPYVQEAIANILKEREDVYFLFGFTDEFIKHPRVINYAPFCDEIFKAKFINSCDAMIHARNMGESFGLAIAEFSIKNKPVITLNGGNDKAHLQMLGNKALYYNNYDEVYNILKNFSKDICSIRSWDAYSEKYNPDSVMKKFKEVFID
jgi:hypothetical protein